MREFLKVIGSLVRVPKPYILAAVLDVVGGT